MGYNHEVFNSQRELKVLSNTPNEIIVKAKYGPSKPTKIPLNINEELACFVAAIIGDGHLKKSKFQTTIECSNKGILESLRSICIKIFRREFNISPRRIIQKGRKDRFCLRIDSKAIHNFLQYVFEIPAGKKSDIVKVPKHIKKANKSIKSAFLIGIMITDGGKRRRGFGLSTASKQLWEDLVILFNDIGIKVKTDKWVHKKYKKDYYGLFFKKERLSILTRECRSGQTGQILFRCNNLREGYA